MHTEAEAKTKWCPMVRTGLTAGMSVNRHISGDVDDETRCIGSACMMWRWQMAGTGAYLDDGWMVWPIKKVEDQDILAHPGFTRTPPDTARGYCGLAGK